MRSKYNLGILFGNQSIEEFPVCLRTRTCVMPFPSSTVQYVVRSSTFVTYLQEFSELSALDIFRENITTPFITSVNKTEVFKK